MLNSILLFSNDYLYEPNDDLQELFDKFIRINSNQPRKINGVDDIEEQALADEALQKYGQFICTFRDVMTHLILGDYKQNDVYVNFNRNILTIEIMNLFNDPQTFFNSYFNNNITANNRIQASRKAFEANMSNLIDLGIMKNIAENPVATMNFKRIFLEKYDAYLPSHYQRTINQKHIQNKKSDRNIYQQISFTASDLYDYFSKNDDFLQRIKYFARFFSQYMIFSILGDLIDKRISEVIPNHQGLDAIFRYKHNYIMESIYDFHLLDLLIAIENMCYCKLKIVPNPREENFTELFVLPLEIRISTSNGREHLIYYDPFHHSLGSTRIDYLSEIQIYANIKDVKCTNGQKFTSTDLHSYTIKQEIKRARELKAYIWGVDTGSITGFPVNQTKQKPIHVKMVLQYDPTKDQDLYNKLVSEKRHGRVTKKNKKLIYDIDVLAPREMTPWIRSYYSHITELNPPTSSPYFIVNLQEELNILYGYYQTGNKLELYNSTLDNSHQENSIKETYNINEILYDTSKNAMKTHGALFNEYLSFQTKALIDAIIISQNEDKTIKELVKLENHEHYIDPNDPKFQNLFESFKYACLDNTSYLGDILPFTYMELRYLKTCLQDSYAHYFFDQSEINELLEYIDKKQPKEIKPFNSKFINYYDLPVITRKEDHDFIIHNFKTLIHLLSSQEHHEIHFQYHSSEIKDIICQPLWITFDKQTHLFFLVALNADIRESYLLHNIMTEIEEMERSYDYQKALQKAKTMRAENYTSITFTFRNERNMPDRVLNDFMPWKKECQYDSSSKMFTTTFYFYESDKKDIMERIMKYGYFVRVENSSENSSQSLYKEILKRIFLQRTLTKAL